MAELMKSWRIWVLLATVLAATLIIGLTGLSFGIDFQGGTLFQVHLSEDVNSMETVLQVMESRLNWSGLKDTRIYGAENRFVFIIVPETEESDVKRIESLIRQQGRFEVLIDGNVMLAGEGIINVDQDPQVPAFEKAGENSVRWRLPFTLSIEAAKKFREMSFHKCRLIDYETSDYDCSLTYFYIDRPQNSILVLSRQRFSGDREIYLSGTEKIPRETSIEEVMQNYGSPYFVAENSQFSEEQLEELRALGANGKTTAIVQAELPEEIVSELSGFGFKTRKLSSVDREQEPLKKVPWTYNATGLKTIVRLSPTITGNKPYVELPEQAKLLTDLHIVSQVSADSAQEAYELAKRDRDETKIIISSGSLPVSVESISHFWTSPTQGKEFLVQAALTGLIVLATVSLIIFLRYRRVKLAMAIIFTALVEAFVTMSFTSALGQSIDLAAIAGIIAAVGTGVDDQIVITDELLKGEEDKHVSLLRRVKRAFFIVIAAAATTLATMVPIILFGSVMVKLVGFAIAITVGVLVGIFVTRPAFGEIARYILGEY